MKKQVIKKIVGIIGFSLSIFIFSGCNKVDEEVQNVIDEIALLDEESMDNLDSFEEKYERVMSDYDALWDDQKDQVDNYDTLLEIGDELEDLKQKENEEKMKSYANDFIDALPTYTYQTKNLFMTNFNNYYEYLTDEQKTEALVFKAQFDSFDYFIEDTKQYLKNPNSFTIYDGSIHQAIEGDDGEYSVTIEINYGATNDFGGEVENDAWGIVDFTIDIETQDIEFTGCINSTYVDSL